MQTRIIIAHEIARKTQKRKNTIPTDILSYKI